MIPDNYSKSSPLSLKIIGDNFYTSINNRNKTYECGRNVSITDKLNKQRIEQIVGIADKLTKLERVRRAHAPLIGSPNYVWARTS